MADAEMPPVDGIWFSRRPLVDGDRNEILILGIGDISMGDVGAGVQVVRQLERELPIAGVDLHDGGSAGIELLTKIGAVHAVIIVMAACNGRPVGTLAYRQPREVGELPDGFMAHECGLRDVFAAATLIGKLPVVHLFTISIGTAPAAGPGLSPAVAEAVPLAVSVVHGHALRLALHVTVQ